MQSTPLAQPISLWPLNGINVLLPQACAWAHTFSSVHRYCSSKTLHSAMHSACLHAPMPYRNLNTVPYQHITPAGVLQWQDATECNSPGPPARGAAAGAVGHGHERASGHLRRHGVRAQQRDRTQRPEPQQRAAQGALSCRYSATTLLTSHSKAFVHTGLNVCSALLEVCNAAACCAGRLSGCMCTAKAPCTAMRRSHPEECCRAGWLAYKVL